MTQWIWDHVIQPILQWIMDMVTWTAIKVWDLVLSALATIINAIPVPSFIGDIAGYLSGISPSIGWFLSSFQVPFGLQVIIGAYLVRFLIRRLPVIG